MRKVHIALLGVAVAAAGPLAPALAAAQDSPPARGQILQREQLGSYGAADAARGRARRGDCAGALTLFDQAISTIDDPTLRRDRGLCHERQGDPFPAIDDYRAYLTRMPDAPDSGDIAARLQRLEAQVGVGGPSPFHHSTAAAAGGGATVTVDGKEEKYDSAKVEADDTSGPLRKGTGWVLAPMLGLRKWFNSDLSQSTWAEHVGLRLAYAWNETSSLLAEAGYERFNTGEAEAVSLSGLTSQLGYEARLPFDKERNIDNLAIVGLGIGYEHLMFGFQQASGLSAPNIGGIGLRGRFGYRHNFGGRAAFEVSLDGGFAKFFTYGSGSSSATSATPWLGVNLALLFGT